MATLPAYFQQNPDVAAAYQQETYGLTPQQFADTHFALYGQTEQRATPVAAVTPATITPAAMTPTTTTSAPPALPTYFTQNPDVAASYLVNNYGLTPQQFADTHYTKFGQYEQRISPTGAPAIIPKKPVTPVVKPPVTPVVNTTNTGSSLQYFRLNPDVAASYLVNNYGMTPEQFAAAHFAKYGQFEERTAPNATPFFNATQGFDQSFQNYQSIPIGSQYNPSAVGGTGSPYSQIMGQMRPAGPFNPYMDVVSNTPMGGYDPGLYERIARANSVASLIGGTPDQAGGMSIGGDNVDSSPGPGDGQGPGAGDGGGGASGDCVDPNVHILLADRSTVRAGDLKVGDMLHTLHDTTFVYGDFPVEYVNILQRPKVEALFDDGQKIIVSITHKFLTADNQWEKISDIEIGTFIRGFEDVTKKLVSITDVGTGPVIEMVVTDAHTYISEGLVSHNKFYGGLITNVSGPDPAGPDEGQVNMMRGEYVIKKSAVNKYGRGLLDMINEGKVPAKKIKSLLD